MVSNIIVNRDSREKQQWADWNRSENLISDQHGDELIILEVSES